MKHVQKFNLDDPEDKALYEELINNSDCMITHEEFTYSKTRDAEPIITVWWIEDRALI